MSRKRPDVCLPLPPAQRHRERLAEEIHAYATAEAGSKADLDPALEHAALQALTEPAGLKAALDLP